MTAMMQTSIAMGMTRMPSMPLIQGSMATDDPRKTKMIGIGDPSDRDGRHRVRDRLRGIVAAVGLPGWLVGLIVGLAHGVVAGVFMKMMATTHRRMRPAANFTGGETWRHDASGLHLAEPGAVRQELRAGDADGLLMAHTVIGLVVGSVYAAIV